MTTTKKRTTTTAKAKSTTTAAKLQQENAELTERYNFLQQRIGGLRHHVATNESITAADVIRLLDNVIDAS